MIPEDQNEKYMAEDRRRWALDYALRANTSGIYTSGPSSVDTLIKNAKLIEAYLAGEDQKKEG